MDTLRDDQPFGRLLPDSLAGDAPTVAKRLLGARLVRTTRADGADKEGLVLRSGFIVETEAYTDLDPASHSFRGKTKRNAAMFGRAGLAYVYFSYGNHFCLNVVCEEEGKGAAVLLRSLEPELGICHMALARGRQRDLTNGPGRLTCALGVDRGLDGIDLLTDDRLYLAPGRTHCPDEIVTSTRIGISKGAETPWRFLVRGNPYVSRAPGRNPAPHCA